MRSRRLAPPLADSPFADRLNTNYAPSDIEILEIRALLVEPVDELARMDTQIEEMEFALGQLKEKRESLKAPFEAHKALISPIRRIPQDVLLEIFFFCLPSAHDALIDPAEAPMLLGRICGHWRSIAYSTPRIWSSIYIPSLNHRNFPRDMVLPPDIGLKLGGVIAGWLERSATCPLSVSLSETPHSPDGGLGHHRLLSQLLKVSRRLRRITLTGDIRSLRPLLCLGADDLPLLESIRIEQTLHLRIDDHPDATDALQIPTLHDISLSISMDPLLLPLRWSQLTRLSLVCRPFLSTNGVMGGLDAGDALDVLRRCPNLVWCHMISSKETDPEDTIDMSLVTLPYLHTLILRGNCFLPDYISCLVLPKLRHLRIGKGSLESFRYDPTHSSSSLRVDIASQSLATPKLIELLRHFPTISHLRLASDALRSGSASLDDAFLALFCTPHDTLCPMLTHLTVTNQFTGFSDAAALTFVRARMIMPCPLQQFRVDFLRPMEVDIMPELRSFISEDGLLADLRYSPPLPWKFNPREGLSAPQPLY